MELRGYLTPEMPRLAGSASWSIDGSPPVTFPLLTWTSGFRGTGVNDSIWRHTMLRTPPVPPGEHTLELVNLGSPTTVPLTIDYFLISHGDIDNPMKAPDRPGQVIASTAPIPVKSMPPTISTTSSPQKIKIAPIVGGVVGGIVVFACIGVLVYFCLLKRRRSRKDEPPTRLTYEEAAALNIRTRDLTVATNPYSTEPTPDAFDGGAAHPFPQPFTQPAQMANRAKPPMRRLPPPLAPRQPLMLVTARTLSPASTQEELPDSISSLYTGSPPVRAAPLGYGSPSDQHHPTTTSPASVSPSMSVQVGSATVEQFDRAGLPRGIPLKKGYSP